jgi:hypothetical protein
MYKDQRFIKIPYRGYFNKHLLQAALLYGQYQ